MWSIIDKFRETVNRYPNQVAVVHHLKRDEFNSITYKELDKTSDIIAGFLCDRGVAPGTQVGLYMRKSVEHVALILGILKAGGAFYTINSKLKSTQLRNIIKSTQTPLLFIDNSTLLNLSTEEDLKWLEASLVHYSFGEMNAVHKKGL